MADSVSLLKLLEPLIRPGGLPGPARPPTPPVEQRDFESLLREAKDRSPAQAQTAGAAPAATNDGQPPAMSGGANALAELASIDRLDNAAMLEMLGRQRLEP